MKKILVSLTAIMMIFAFTIDVRADEYNPAYTVMIGELDGIYSEFSFSDAISKEQSKLEGTLKYTDEKAVFSAIDNDGIIAFADNEEKTIEINLNGDNMIRRFGLTNINVKITGTGTLTFTPGKWDGDNYIDITDKASQKEFISKHISNAKDIEVAYVNGVVVIGKDIGLEGYNDIIQNEDGFIFASTKDLSNDYTLSGKDITNTFTDDVKKSFVTNGQTLLGIYDINIMNGTTVVPMEDGDFLVSIPMTEEMKKFNNLKIAYIKDNKIQEYLDAIIDEEGYISFKTSHLSQYAVIGLNDAEAPNTLDNTSMSIMAGIIALIGLGTSVVYLKKKVNEM